MCVCVCVAGDQVPQFFVLGEALAASLTLLETSSPGCLHMSKQFYERVDVSRLPEKLHGFDKAPASDEAVSYMVVMLADSPMEAVAVLVSVCLCLGGALAFSWLVCEEGVVEVEGVEL